MRVRMFCAAVLLAFVPGLAYGQAGSTFTPVPCPEQAWESTDPAFQPLAGAQAFSGRYGGALYQIEIPDNWNGELVLYAHGAVRNNVLRVQTPLLRAHLIRNRFAWGASSYRCNGSVSGIGLVDTMALSDIFQKVNQGRAPKRTYLTGQSLGGRIIILGVVSSRRASMAAWRCARQGRRATTSARA